MPREWYISEALHSVRRLRAVIDDLTEDEVLAALELEAGSRRRASVLDLLVDRAVFQFKAKLKERIHGP
jgi:hypothetical protein